MRSVIFGAGTYGQVYLAYLQEAGVEVVGFIDDDPTIQGSLVGGIPVIGNHESLKDLKQQYNLEAFYCPLGNNQLRVKFMEMAKDAGFALPNYIHPSVVLSPHVIIGEGVYILLGTHIMPHTLIKDYVMISMGVNVAHHVILEKGVFLSTGCNFGASIVAREKAYCGISSTIMTGIHELGKNCLIGAGAVVIHDVPDNAVMAGVPAKCLKFKD